MKHKKMILLVEDNPDILWANHAVFTAQGYDVITAESIAEAREHIVKMSPDAIVLDLLLPDGNALNFISEIRGKTTAPILVLTALNEKDDRLVGLRAGGDDYITIPYDIDELCERVAAFLRRDNLLETKPVRVLSCGRLKLDIIAGCAYSTGKDMLLPKKEFAALVLLVQNEGKVLSKEYLCEHIWKRPFCDDDDAIKSVVYRLRKKLETSGSGYDILSHRGKGYTFIEI